MVLVVFARERRFQHARSSLKQGKLTIFSYVLVTVWVAVRVKRRFSHFDGHACTNVAVLEYEPAYMFAAAVEEG